jgi:inner membrane protein
MSPITHFLVSWTIANAIPHSTKRDRAIVCLAGIAPDIDGLGIIAEILTRDSPQPLLWWSEYHHTLGHNFAAAVLVTAVAAYLAKSRGITALLACLTFHLHLLCDVIGSRGPDGYQWPIPYLLPYSSSVQWAWEGQWALNSWQNMAITAVAIGATMILARRRGYSPLELVSGKIDAVVVEAIRHRFPLRA